MSNFNSSIAGHSLYVLHHVPKYLKQAIMSLRAAELNARQGQTEDDKYLLFRLRTIRAEIEAITINLEGEEEDD